MKQQVIYSDQPKKPDENKSSLSKIVLSDKEYRETIKTAYKEGMQDALEEDNPPQEKQEEQKEQEQPPKGSMKEKEKKQPRHNTPYFREKTSLLPKGGQIKKQKQKHYGAKQDAVKAEAQERAAVRQRFETITERHDIELLHVKTVFPFTIFPDNLIIDTTKVTISRKILFATEYVTTIPLKDLSDVYMQTLLFLGSLDIKYMPQASSAGILEPVQVRIANLRRQDAINAKNILKGALVAKAEEIDIAKLTPQEVVNVLDEFGKSHGVI